MLDVLTLRVLSILLLVGSFTRIAILNSFTKKRQDLGSVKASKHTGFILHQGWLVLTFLTPIFYLIGAIVPNWLYGTILNISFNGAEYLQVVSVPIFLIGGTLTGWSEHTLGQLMKPQIEVVEKHQLITTGPYARIRHPGYTGIALIDLAPTLLLLNLIPLIDFTVIATMAYKRARLEEQLLASPNTFGKTYQDYMQKTGAFLPKLRKTKPPTD